MDTTTLLAIVFVNSVVFGIVGALIGREKEAALPGFLFGFLLSFLGLLVVICALDNREECPVCKAGLPRNAITCAKCRTELEWISGKPYRRSSRNTEAVTSKRRRSVEEVESLAIETLGPPKTSKP